MATPIDPSSAATAVDVTVNNRYQLRRWTGRSLLADDFEADDLLLGRTVLFKALRPELVGDKAFVDRFRSQAQAGANLNHPAICAVLDWGRDAGGVPDGSGGTRPGPTYYLVAEHAEGRTLRQLISANGPMPVDRAAHVIVAMTAALGFAHRSGALHGNLTPDLVRVSPSGVVKVLDLGLIRALGSSWGPGHDDLETARWLSPEQLRGEPPTERSDVYQVGLLAYYLTTGAAPYGGETVEEVRDQHLRQVPAAPTRRNPALPKPFESFIGRSMAKVVDDRYGSVHEQRSAMVRVRERIGAASAGTVAPVAAAAAPIAAAPRLRPVAEPDETSVENTPDPSPRSGDDAATRALAVDAALNTADDPTTVASNGLGLADVEAERDDTKLVPLSDAGESKRRRSSRKGAISEDAPLPSGPDQSWDKLDKAPRRWPYLVTLLVLLGVLVALVLMLLKQLGVGSSTGTVTVPSLMGRPVAEAQEALKELGLRPDVQREASATEPADRVLGQSPDPGQKLAEGSLVILRVSTGSTKPTVPNVVGMTSSQAEAALASYGLASIVQTKTDDTAPAGNVVSQEPRPDTVVEPGATVTIQVAVSSGNAEIPDVKGKTVDEARAALLKEGFLIVVQSEPSNDVASGLVIRTEPASGSSVPKGSSVVIMSSGGDVLTVPSVIGKDQASATAALQDIGLIVESKERAETDPTNYGRVVAQSPEQGSQVALGTRVIIRIGVPAAATTTKPPTSATVVAPDTAPVLQTVPTAPPTTPAPTTPPAAPAPAPDPVPAAAAPTPSPAPAAPAPAPAPVPVVTQAPQG